MESITQRPQEIRKLNTIMAFLIHPLKSPRYKWITLVIPQNIYTQIHQWTGWILVYLIDLNSKVKIKNGTSGMRKNQHDHHILLILRISAQMNQKYQKLTLVVMSREIDYRYLPTIVWCKAMNVITKMLCL